MPVKDLLLEIGTEEIPSGYLFSSLKSWARIVREELEKARIGFQEIKSLGTPRRLVLWGRGLEEEQKPLVTERLGPAFSAAFDSTGRCRRHARR